MPGFSRAQRQRGRALALPGEAMPHEDALGEKA